ncbi:complement regulator-acquiring protein [Borreliella valaisiana]|uniref:complement regulator-acquiring protein n=1 Tax=Borreliella valaisiana TaxID=62088 RepID=UPI002ED2BD35|nr:complement regulator-acquiring protein [Borreliella valaisiana]
MTKPKMNIIKFNIATILTLVCISCIPVNKINTNNPTNPKKSSNTNLRKTNNTELTRITKNFENKSNKSSNESEDLGSSNQKPKEDIISKLKAIGKKLEAQKEQENTEIAKIAAESDFLNTFKVGIYDLILEDTQMQIKRIIYSSLNYEIQKIETLKEILEKLKKNSQYQRIVGSFIHNISWSIQFKIDDCLESINDKLHTLDKEKSEILLIHTESSLKIKQRFAKTLNATIEAYNQNSENIKNNEEELAKHMNKNYQGFNSLNPIDD